MTKITLGETRRGIVLTLEDERGSRTFHLLWREAAGLFHELTDTLTNPSFKVRDPKSHNPEIRNLRTIEDISN